MFSDENMIIAQYGIRRAKNLCELRGAGTVKDVWCVPLTILLILMLVACSPADSSSSSGIDENGQEGNRKMCIRDRAVRASRTQRPRLPLSLLRCV